MIKCSGQVDDNPASIADSPEFRPLSSLRTSVLSICGPQPHFSGLTAAPKVHGICSC